MSAENYDWIDSNPGINVALLSQGHNNLLNPDRQIVLMRNTGKDQSQEHEIYYLKPLYQEEFGVANIQVYHTNTSVQKKDQIEYSKNLFRIVAYELIDIKGIDKNTGTGGDVIRVKNRPGLWYIVVQQIQSNDSFCSVVCYQTNQDPEKGNTLKSEVADVYNFVTGN